MLLAGMALRERGPPDVVWVRVSDPEHVADEPGGRRSFLDGLVGPDWHPIDEPRAMTVSPEDSILVRVGVRLGLVEEPVPPAIESVRSGWSEDGEWVEMQRVDDP